MEFHRVGTKNVFRSFFWKSEILRKFGQKSKLRSKIEIGIENSNLVRKSKFWIKIEILIKNLNFGQQSKLRSKIEI